MKRLVILAWLLAPLQAQMLSTIVGGSPAAAAAITATNTGNGLCLGGGGASGSGSIPLGTTAATGNFIVVVLSQQGVPAVNTDNYGNTYTALTATGGTTPPAGRMFYSANAAGGTSHTVPFTGTFVGGCAAVFTGLSATPFDKEAHIADHVGSTVQPGSVAPAGTPSLFISEVNLGIGATASSIDSSYITSGSLAGLGSNNYGVVLYYKISSSTENPIITLGASMTTSAQNAVFK